MFVKFKFTIFFNTRRPAPDSELSICLISLAVSNKHDLRHKKLNAFYNIYIYIRGGHRLIFLI